MSWRSKLNVICVLMTALLVLNQRTIAQPPDTTAPQGTYSIAWSPDYRTLAAANADGTVTIFSVDGTMIATLSGHEDRALAVAWSPDGASLATGGRDAFLRVWNTSTWSLDRELAVYDGGIHSIAWQPFGDTLLGSGFDTLYAWSVTNWERQITPRSATVLRITWNHDGSQFALAGTPNTVAIGRLSGDQPELRVFAGHENYPRDVRWSSDGTRVITAGGADGTVRVWDAESGDFVVILSVPETIMSGATFLGTDDRYAAAVDQQGAVTVINLATGEIVETLQEAIALSDVAWNPVACTLTVSGLPLEWDDQPQSAQDHGSFVLRTIPLSVAALCPAITTQENEPAWSRCWRSRPNRRDLTPDEPPSAVERGPRMRTGRGHLGLGCAPRAESPRLKVRPLKGADQPRFG